MLFDDAVSVSGGAMVAGGFAFGKAGNAEVIVRALYTLYANLWEEPLAL